MSGYPGPVPGVLDDYTPIGEPRDEMGACPDNSGRYYVFGPHKEFTRPVKGGWETYHRNSILIVPERLPWVDPHEEREITLEQLRKFSGVLRGDASASGWENCLTPGGGTERAILQAQIKYLRQFAIQGIYSLNNRRGEPEDRFSCSHQDRVNVENSNLVPIPRTEWIPTPRERAMGLPVTPTGEVLCHGLDSERVPRFGRSVDISGIFMLVCGCVDGNELPSGACYRPDVYTEGPCPHLMWHAMTPVRTWENPAGPAILELRSEIFDV